MARNSIRLLSKATTHGSTLNPSITVDGPCKRGLIRRDYWTSAVGELFSNAEQLMTTPTGLVAMDTADSLYLLHTGQLHGKSSTFVPSPGTCS